MELSINVAENVNFESVSDTVKMLSKSVQSIAKELHWIYKEKDTEKLFQWMEDNAIDFTYIVDRKKRLKGAEILVGFGGPNIYVDTRDCSVKGYWGIDYVRCYLSTEACEWIDENYIEDLYELN